MRYQEILRWIEKGKTSYVTKEEDNLLHLLLRLELQEKLSLSHIQKLLEQNPKLINTENKAGQLPTDILDEIQNERTARLISLPKQLDRLPKQTLFITQKKPLQTLLKLSKELDRQRM